MSQKAKPKILIIGAQHGDERLGPKVHRYLRANSSMYPNVDYVCGNPKAYRRNIRFTETDLNRSYDAINPKTYEQKRAQKILNRVKSGNYDFVLDIHTSRSKVGSMLIATHLGQPVKKVISASKIKRIAIMPPNIADCSLIGRMPQAISVEYDRLIANKKFVLMEVVEIVDNLSNDKAYSIKREIYYVQDTIPVNFKPSKNIENFKLTDAGFYPVIFKNKGGSYKHHKGFMARRKEVAVI